MIKSLIVGIWACLVALGASYATASWKAGSDAPVEEEGASDAVTVDGLEYHTIGPITVPMIAGSKLQGYVLAKLVFTADAAALHAFPLEPGPFLVDEAFRTIYTDGKIQFNKLDKYNLSKITDAVKANVNKRFGVDIIKDVLVDEVNYVDKDNIVHPIETDPLPEGAKAPAKGGGGH